MRRILILAIATVIVWSCNDKPKETILDGSLDLLCDESLVPIMEDQIAVFESDYRARINLKPMSEAEVVKSILVNPGQVAILSRDLSPDELAHFEQKKIYPKRTQFATDAIAFIRKKGNDTLIRLEDVIAFANGKQVPGIKGLVFDNLNSGTYRAIAQLAGLKAVPSQGVYSFTSNAEAIKYVAENEGVVGVIGYNWLTQPEPGMEPLVKQLSVLSVKGEKEGYFAPTQENLGLGNYPLARNLFLINCQGKEGPGMGFASFIAGERGQRIILKSGLLPVRMPSRNIIIRNTVE